jgi:ATP-binding cassette subfamily B protein
MLSTPLQSLRHEAQDLQSATASIQRIEDLFALQPSTVEAVFVQQPAILPAGPLAVTFEQVTFHYEDNANVLKNLSFVLPAGKVLGVLGRTGSGKSTLTRLLFRLYDPSQGCIRLNELNLRDIPIKGLRRRVGMVTQDVQLFQASLRDNMAFFNPAVSDAQLEMALKELHMWEWVLSQPAGLNTRLNSAGQGLSAGEAQLFAFARVFLKDPGLVILDEASSRLDPVTETIMERAVDRLFVGRTGIIIAHRLKTVQRADDILILEDGWVVEYGPRTALAQDPSSRFYSLMQTGLEEALA